MDDADKARGMDPLRECTSLLSASCSVCGSPAAAHLHYGAISCYSCRAFFRRGPPRQSKCIFGHNKCQINSFNRTNCKYCRYSRCLEMGMKPDKVDATLNKRKEREERAQVDNVRKRQRDGKPKKSRANSHDEALQQVDMEVDFRHHELEEEASDHKPEGVGGIRDMIDPSSAQSGAVDDLEHPSAPRPRPDADKSRCLSNDSFPDRVPKLVKEPDRVRESIIKLRPEIGHHDFDSEGSELAKLPSFQAHQKTEKESNASIWTRDFFETSRKNLHQANESEHPVMGQIDHKGLLENRLQRQLLEDLFSGESAYGERRTDKNFQDRQTVYDIYRADSRRRFDSLSVTMPSTLDAGMHPTTSRFFGDNTRPQMMASCDSMPLYDRQLSQPAPAPRMSTATADSHWSRPFSDNALERFLKMESQNLERKNLSARNFNNFSHYADHSNESKIIMSTTTEANRSTDTIVDPQYKLALDFYSRQTYLKGFAPAEEDCRDEKFSHDACLPFSGDRTPQEMLDLTRLSLGEHLYQPRPSVLQLRSNFNGGPSAALEHPGGSHRRPQPTLNERPYFMVEPTVKADPQYAPLWTDVGGYEEATTNKGDFYDNLFSRNTMFLERFSCCTTRDETDDDDDVLSRETFDLTGSDDRDVAGKSNGLQLNCNGDDSSMMDSEDGRICAEVDIKRKRSFPGSHIPLKKRPRMYQLAYPVCSAINKSFLSPAPFTFEEEFTIMDYVVRIEEYQNSRFDFLIQHFRHYEDMLISYVTHTNLGRKVPHNKHVEGLLFRLGMEYTKLHVHSIFQEMAQLSTDVRRNMFTSTYPALVVVFFATLEGNTQERTWTDQHKKTLFITEKNHRRIFLQVKDKISIMRSIGIKDQERFTSPWARDFEDEKKFEKVVSILGRLLRDDLHLQALYHMLIMMSPSSDTPPFVRNDRELRKIQSSLVNLIYRYLSACVDRQQEPPEFATRHVSRIRGPYSFQARPNSDVTESAVMQLSANIGELTAAQKTHLLVKLVDEIHDCADIMLNRSLPGTEDSCSFDSCF